MMSRRTYRCLDSIVLLALCITCTAQAGLSSHSTSPIDADFIRVALDRYYSEGLRDIKATYEYVDEYTDYGFAKVREHFATTPSLARTEPQQRRVRNVSSWWMADGRYRYEYNDAARTVEGEEFVFDRVVADSGTVTSLLSVRHLGDETQARGSLMQSTQNHIGHPDSIRFGMGIGPIHFDRYFRDKEIVVLEPEPVDGHTCYVVQVASPYGVLQKIWFDPQKDFRAPLIQCLDNKGRLLGETRTTFQQTGHTWFPAHGECTYYDSAEDGTRIATRVESYDAKTVELNSGIDPTVFAIQFPPGTVVYDKSLKTSYLIPGDDVIDSLCDTLITNSLALAGQLTHASQKGSDANATPLLEASSVDPDGLARSHRPSLDAEGENGAATSWHRGLLARAHLWAMTVVTGICTIVLVVGWLIYDRKREDMAA